MKVSDTGKRPGKRDRTRRQLRLNLPQGDPIPAECLQVIPIPAEPTLSPHMMQVLLKQLRDDDGTLVLHDRVVTPREVAQSLELCLQTVLDSDSVRLLLVDAPRREFWREVEPDSLPLPESKLRELAASRDLVYHVPDLARLVRSDPPVNRSGSALYIGIGDHVGKWLGVIESCDKRRNVLSTDRLTLAVILARHFEKMLASAIRLQSMIFLDSLTGLYNRPYFLDQMERQITVARRRAQSLAICIIDVDDFKDFNTKFGYDGGDRVLKAVGSQLKSALRTSDTLARYGGEEFAALLAAPLQPEEARQIAERLRRAVGEHDLEMLTLGHDRADVQVTVSVGLALFPEDAGDVQEIWNEANRRLLRAKSLGKDRVCFEAGEDPAG